MNDPRYAQLAEHESHQVDIRIEGTHVFLDCYTCNTAIYGVPSVPPERPVVISDTGDPVFVLVE